MWKCFFALMSMSLFVGCGAPQYSTRMHEQITRYKLEKEPLVVLVDYDKSIYSTRFYVVNPRTKEVIFSSKAGHARKSGRFYAKDFSNVVNSLKSSLGLYRIGHEYPGKHGRSINLHGLEKSNSNAYKRRVVLHGDDSTYSSGCITVTHTHMKVLLDTLKPGMKLVVYR